MTSDAEILGRDGVDDLDAILSTQRADPDEAIHVVQDHADAIFTWDYEKGARPQLNKLYEKAKHAQWNRGRPTSTGRSPTTAKPAESMIDPRLAMFAAKGIDLSRSPLASWGRGEWAEFGLQIQNWSLSQFLHGEQARWCARPRSSRRCRGSTPSTTPPPR